ncbi:TPA: hypothetical protein HA244_04335 [Candidatus Micrarchaeota archaeon]|nr:hypothetical protein [Candidatus Micrarchaeota archaeon]
MAESYRGKNSRLFGLHSVAQTPEELLQIESRISEVNMGLVWGLARKFSKKYPSVDLGDMVGEGYLGLRIAIQKYDLARGTSFATYAPWWIRQSILHFLNFDVATVHVPLAVRKTMREIAKLKHEMRAKGLVLTAEEIKKRIPDANAEFLGSPKPPVFKLPLNAKGLDRSGTPRPLTDILASSSLNPEQEFIEGEAAMLEKRKLQLRRRKLENLKELITLHSADRRAAKILLARMDGATYDEIRLKTSPSGRKPLVRERIRQIIMDNLVRHPIGLILESKGIPIDVLFGIKPGAYEKEKQKFEAENGRLASLAHFVRGRVASNSISNGSRWASGERFKHVHALIAEANYFGHGNWNSFMKSVRSNLGKRRWNFHAS